ncbi:MAG: DUF4956 domain-containing protein [Oscillospiraceae bacterium]|nr:DUF4956 domain-containing protein [Oscillospiraceae bacterium]
MKDYILTYLSDQANLDTGQLIVNMLVAFALGMGIFIAYRITYSGVAYSRKFNASLVMMTLVTTIVMTVISNNIALSLGMVGALSIVRFRTAIKDPRDTTFIFWCIAVGICCGVSFYLPAAIGSAAVFIAILLLGRVRSEGVYLLIIRGKRTEEKQIESIVYLYIKSAELRVKNTSGSDIEYIFSFRRRSYEQAEKEAGESISSRLYKLETVTAANLVAQDEDISR